MTEQKHTDKRTEIVDEIDKRMKDTTDLISNRVRTVAGGVAVFAWSFLIGAPSAQSLKVDRASLFGAILLSLLSLLADFLQYGFNWLDHYYRRMCLISGAGEYDPRIFYLASMVLFLLLVKGYTNGLGSVLVGGSAGKRRTEIA